MGTFVLNGALAERYAYSPFGQVNAPSHPAIGNPYLFAGREFDSETGLYYSRARYYDPDMGRFLSTDPLGYADGMNLYAYVRNNPINRVDPLGLTGSDRKSGTNDCRLYQLGSRHYGEHSCSSTGDAPASLDERKNDAVLLASGAWALDKTFAGYSEADFRGAFPSELHNASGSRIRRAENILRQTLQVIMLENISKAMTAGSAKGLETVLGTAVTGLIPGTIGKLFRTFLFSASFSHSPEPTRVATFTCSASRGCTGAIEVRR